MPRECWLRIQTPDCGNVIPATGSWGHLTIGYAAIIAWYAISVTAIYWLPIKKSVLRISRVLFRTDHYCQAAYFPTAGDCIPFWRGGLFVPALYSHPSYKQDRCTWVFLAPGVAVLAKFSAIAYVSPISLFFSLQEELVRKFLIIQTTCGRLFWARFGRPFVRLWC